MRGIRQLVEDFNHYAEISNVKEVSRRYFVMNSFDGVMTMIGVVSGAYFAGGPNGFDVGHVLGAGIGAVVAMAVSGFSGTFMAETAERTSELKKMEKLMLKKMRGTVQEKAMRFASVYAALVDGVSPSLSSALCLIPFFLARFGTLPIHLAMQTSLITGFIVLFLLGMYLGKISKENMINAGVRMFMVGGIVGVLSIIMDKIFYIK